MSGSVTSATDTSNLVERLLQLFELFDVPADAIQARLDDYLRMLARVPVADAVAEVMYAAGHCGMLPPPEELVFKATYKRLRRAGTSDVKLSTCVH